MDERTGEILSECKAIVEAIEGQTVSLSRVALKARRLAQLVDDDAAFMWLSLECSGADGLSVPTREWKDRSGDEVMKGTEKYVKLHGVPDFGKLSLTELASRIAQGGLPEKTRVAGAPLAALEVQNAMSREDRQQIAGQPGGHEILAMAAAWDNERRKVLERVAGAIHEWATSLYIVLKFRQLAGNWGYSLDSSDRNR